MQHVVYNIDSMDVIDTKTHAGDLGLSPSESTAFSASQFQGRAVNLQDAQQCTLESPEVLMPDKGWFLLPP